jgi:hypothetical protein
MARINEMFTRKFHRNYEVLNPDVALTVAGETASVATMAEQYAPVFFADPRLGNMRPDNLLFEAQSPATRLVFNYYLSWKDEIHPNPVMNPLYRGFRSVVYGSARDIEFVQVAVSFKSGEVRGFAFERDPSGRHDHPNPSHALVQGVRTKGEKQFTVTVAGKTHGAMNVQFDDQRLCILVATWNHIYDFYTGDGIQLADTPLKFLSDDLYKKYYMARRSRPPVAGN